MPVNQNTIVVFDFETGGLDVDTLEPVQVAAAALDPRTLQVKDTFSSLMRPLDMENLDQKALDVNGKTREELRAAPEQKLVWGQFAAFLKRHARKGGVHGLPIPAGKNIRSFDLPIYERLCRTYKMVDKKGRANLFHQRRLLELEDVLWQWFESDPEVPDLRMDTLRPYFGLDGEGAHDALVDTLQTADLLVKFLNLHRTLKGRKTAAGEPVIKFRGSCSKKPAA